MITLKEVGRQFDERTIKKKTMLATRTTMKYDLKLHPPIFLDQHKGLFHICAIKSVFTEHVIVEKLMSSAIIQAFVKINNFLNLIGNLPKNKVLLNVVYLSVFK